MMHRLFAFGCSFTQFYWPTWADILGHSYDYFENWGLVGAGNLYISSAVAEASVRHNFTKDDTIMIMWSNVMREDRYTDRWLNVGSIYNQNIYNKEFVRDFVTIRGCYIRDLAQIQLTTQLLENIGCNYEYMSMVDLTNPNQYENLDASEMIEDSLNLYKNTLDKFKPSVHKTVFNNDWYSRKINGKTRVDLHSTPLEHLEYLDKVLPNSVYISTRQWVEKVNTDVLNFLKDNDKVYTYNGWNNTSNLPKHRL